MRQECTMEPEEMIAKIMSFIEKKKDFFIGGRGIGIECWRMDNCWKIRIERARFTSFPDTIICKNNALCLYNEDVWYAEFDLTHFLKVSAL